VPLAFEVKEMKIALIGPNPTNNLYHIGVSLRRSGHKVVLFNDSWYISDQPVWHHRSIELPSSHPLLSGFSGPEGLELMRQIERDLEWENPDWVKRFYEDFTYSGRLSAKALRIAFSLSYGYTIFRRLLNSSSKRMLKRAYQSLIKMLTEIEEYDLIIAIGSFDLYAYLIGKPYAIVAYGPESPENVLAKKDKIGPMRGARWILTSGALMLQYLKQLGLESKFKFLPLPVDTDLYRPMDRTDLCDISSRLDSISLEGKFVFLVPSRLDFAYKGIDKVIRAFKRLVKYHDRARLILIKWGVDAEKVERLIESLDLQGFCALYPNMLSDPKLVRLYNYADVILDQFPKTLGEAGRMGALGDVGRKVLATGKPLISSFDSAANSPIYDELPPVIYAYTEKEICKAMAELIENPKYVNEIGKKGRNWCLKYHGPDTANRLVEILDKMR